MEILTEIPCSSEIVISAPSTIKSDQVTIENADKAHITVTGGDKI